MLTINVQHGEPIGVDESNQFIYETHQVRLEHSLLSLSRWESKYKKPFLSDLPDHAKTQEELVDYFRMMVLDQSLPVTIFEALITHNSKDIEGYIVDPQTATTIADPKPNRRTQHLRNEIITAEVVYYWMFANQIDKECETWHLNRLMTLIRVFAAKQAKTEKVPRHEAIAQQRDLNAMRRAKYNTKG